MKLNAKETLNLSKKRRTKIVEKVKRKLYRYATHLIKRGAKAGKTEAWFWFEDDEREYLPDLSKRLEKDGFTTKIAAACFHIYWDGKKE